MLQKGFLGTVVVEQLVQSGFSVTVLSRSQASVPHVPSGVSIVQVDYDSSDSITSALAGQDVVVNTMSSAAMVNQKLIIDAAIAAGVKRYVPADYGTFTADAAAHELAVIMPMADVQNYLKTKAAEGALEWTVFQTGVFLDMMVTVAPLAFDPAAKSIQWYDDGEAEFSASTTRTIGRAIAAALKKPDETKNRVVFVHDIVLTQKKLVALGKRYVAAGPEWSETRIDTAEEILRTVDRLSSGQFDMMTMIAQLKAGLLSGKYRSVYKKTDNELLGLEKFSEEDLVELVRTDLSKYS